MDRQRTPVPDVARSRPEARLTATKSLRTAVSAPPPGSSRMIQPTASPPLAHVAGDVGQHRGLAEACLRVGPAVVRAVRIRQAGNLETDVVVGVTVQDQIHDGGGASHGPSTYRIVDRNLSTGYWWWFSIRVLTIKILVGYRETNVKKGGEHLGLMRFPASNFQSCRNWNSWSNRWRIRRAPASRPARHAGQFPTPVVP